MPERASCTSRDDTPKLVACTAEVDGGRASGGQGGRGNPLLHHQTPRLDATCWAAPDAVLSMTIAITLVLGGLHRCS